MLAILLLGVIPREVVDERIDTVEINGVYCERLIDHRFTQWIGRDIGFRIEWWKIPKDRSTRVGTTFYHLGNAKIIRIRARTMYRTNANFDREVMDRIDRPKELRRGFPY